MPRFTPPRDRIRDLLQRVLFEYQMLVWFSFFALWSKRFGADPLVGPDGGNVSDPARILLAEDDEISQAIVQKMLGALDRIELTIVSNGREALIECLA